MLTSDMPSLHHVATNLWYYDATFTSMGLKGSTRMTVIRLPEGLLIHSPVRLSQAEHNHLRTLGPVTYVIAPNTMHYLYFEEFLQHHSGARGFVTDALARKNKRFKAYARISELAPLLENTIEMFEFKGHAIGEAVLFHKPSATLITSDLLYNLQPEHGALEKAVMQVLQAYGKPCVPCYHRLSIHNRPILRAAVKHVAQWPFQRIIMAHGRVIESPDAPNIFKNAWSWA